MDHQAPRSRPPRRARRIAFLGPVVLGAAAAAFVVRRPLLMAAPSCTAGRWHGCFDTFNGVVLMTLVALPLAALVAWALARRRLAAGVASAWPMSLAEVGMVHGTVPFVWLTLMPGSGAGGCSVLIETAQYVLQLDRVSSVDDVLLNAAGAALAALASRRWWRTGAARPQHTG